MNRHVIQSGAARRGRVALPLLVVAIASAGGFWLGVLRNMTNGNLGLAALESSLDFGEVWERGDFPWTLAIENPTSETVFIESLETTCGCTAPTPQSLTIAPGASAEITLQIDLSPRKPAEASLPSTDFSVGVTPIFRQDERQLSGKGWTVRGRVRRALRPADREIAFGRSAQLVTGGPAETLSVTAAALRPLRAVEASADPPLIAATVSRQSSHGDFGGDFRIGVTSNADLPPGPFRCFLNLRPVTDAGERLPPLRLKVEGVVLGPVAAIPDFIDFGLRSPGEVVEAKVRLESLLNKAFQIEKTEARDDSGEPLTIEQDSGGGLLRLRKRLARSGKYSAEARVIVRLEDGERFELVLPISAYAANTKGPAS